MSSIPQHVDLLDPPTLAQTLTSKAATQLQACAAGTATSTTDADATATRTALAAAEKCVALLRAKLIDDNAGGSDDAELPSAKRRAVEREADKLKMGRKVKMKMKSCHFICLASPTLLC